MATQTENTCEYSSVSYLETVAMKEKHFFWPLRRAEIGCTFHGQRSLSSTTALGQSKDRARKAGPRARERTMAFAFSSFSEATSFSAFAFPAVVFGAARPSRAREEGVLPALSRWVSMAPWCRSMSTTLVVRQVQQCSRQETWPSFVSVGRVRFRSGWCSSARATCI